MDLNKIYYELITSFNSYNNEFNVQDEEFGKYHYEMANKYSNIYYSIGNVLGIPGGNSTEIASQLQGLVLSDEQKKKLVSIRKTPSFKKMMGENALQIKDELEQIQEVSSKSTGRSM